MSAKNTADTTVLDGQVKLSDRAERMVESLRVSAPTPEPKPPGVAAPIAGYLLLWLVSTAVAMLIGFQYDPLHLHFEHLSSPLTVSLAMAFAIGATTLVIQKLSVVLKYRHSYFLPGETKVALSRRDQAIVEQLSTADQDVYDAISYWMGNEDRVFGASQMATILAIVGQDRLDLEREQLLANVSSEFRKGLVVVGAMTALLLFVIHSEVPAALNAYSALGVAFVVILVTSPWEKFWLLARNSYARRAQRPAR